MYYHRVATSLMVTMMMHLLPLFARWYGSSRRRSSSSIVKIVTCPSLIDFSCSPRNSYARIDIETLDTTGCGRRSSQSLIKSALYSLLGFECELHIQPWTELRRLGREREELMMNGHSYMGRQWSVGVKPKVTTRVINVALMDWTRDTG